MDCKVATNAKKTPRLKVLKRRRDYLAKVIKEDDEPSSWDKAEHAALSWAIDELEKIHGTTQALSA
jgi:hypothetical protein